MLDHQTLPPTAAARLCLSTTNLATKTTSRPLLWDRWGFPKHMNIGPISACSPLISADVRLLSAVSPFVSPLHYTSCPTFSVLAGTASNGQGFQGLLDALLSIPRVDSKYVTLQVERMTANVFKDPAVAIGTAKEIVETCCKDDPGGLEHQRWWSAKAAGFGEAHEQLARRSASPVQWGLPPNKIISNALQTLVSGLAELRNQHGTGHGKAAGNGEIGSRRARLAVGAATTLCIYLAETHSEIAPQS